MHFFAGAFDLNVLAPALLSLYNTSIAIIVITSTNIAPYCRLGLILGTQAYNIEGHSADLAAVLVVAHFERKIRWAKEKKLNK